MQHSAASDLGLRWLPMSQKLSKPKQSLKLKLLIQRIFKHSEDKHGSVNMVKCQITVFFISGPFNSYEPGHEKMCFMSYANNKGADQPAHPRSLISAFFVCCLDLQIL